MGMLLNFWELAFDKDRDLMREKLAQAKAMGGETYYLYGHEGVPIDSEDCHDRIKMLAEEAHKLGLRLYFDMSPRTWVIPFNEKYPTARQGLIAKAEAPIVDGRWRTKLPEPTYRVMPKPKFTGVEKVFLFDKINDEQIRSAKDVTADFKYDRDGNFLTGSYPGSGTLAIYCYYDTNGIDQSSKEFIQFVDELIALYSDIDIDATGWDEYGASHDGREDYYLMSRTFFDRFKRMYGYDIRDRLYLLDFSVPGNPMARTRLDFYDCLKDITFKTQMHFKEKAKQTFGADTEFGTHHCWWGENNSGDVWRGQIDYFALVPVLTGGFSDSTWENVTGGSVVPMTIFAESLAKRSETGVAYNMAWSHRDNVGFDYNMRILAVRDVRWIGLTWGLNKQEEITHAIARQKALFDFLQGAESQPRVGVLYTWQSVAGIARLNDTYIHVHRYALLNVIRRLVERNVEVALVDTNSPADFSCDLLIVPWPTVMPGKTWDKITSLLAKGGKVVFFGLPAVETAEGDKREEPFSKLAGVEQPDFFGDRKKLPETFELRCGAATIGNLANLKEPRERLAYYPLKPTSGKPIVSCGEEVLGVQNGNVIYVSYDFPMHSAVADSVFDAAGIQPDVIAPPSTLTKVSKKDDLTFLTATPVFPKQEVTGSFELLGNCIEVKGAVLLGVKIKGKSVVEVVGEGIQSLAVNGTPMQWRRIP